MSAKGNCPEEFGYPEKTRCCMKKKSNSAKSNPGNYEYCSFGKIPVYLFYYTVVFSWAVVIRWCCSWCKVQCTTYNSSFYWEVLQCTTKNFDATVKKVAIEVNLTTMQGLGNDVHFLTFSDSKCC